MILFLTFLLSCVSFKHITVETVTAHHTKTINAPRASGDFKWYVYKENRLTFYATANAGDNITVLIPTNGYGNTYQIKPITLTMVSFTAYDYANGSGVYNYWGILEDSDGILYRMRFVSKPVIGTVIHAWIPR